MAPLALVDTTRTLLGLFPETCTLPARERLNTVAAYAEFAGVITSTQRLQIEGADVAALAPFLSL